MRFSFLNRDFIPRLDSQSKKALILAGLLLLTFLLLLAFVYLPARRKLLCLKTELASLERQIRRLEEPLGTAKDLGEKIKLLEARFKELDSRLAGGDEECLQTITDAARSCNLAVLSVKSQDKVPFTDLSGEKVTLQGKPVLAFPASLEISGSFVDLARFLELLNNSLCVLSTVEKLKITKDTSSVTAKLNITLGLKIYITS